MYDFETLNNLDMLDVVEKLSIPVKISGRTHSIKCIAHDDKHPSMVVKDHYAKCYACGAYFGVINFVKKAKSMDFLQACEWLATEFNISPLTPKGGSLRNTGGTKESKGSKEKSLISNLSTLNSKKQSSNLNELQSIIDKSVSNLTRQAAPVTSLRSVRPLRLVGGRGAYAFTLEYVAKHLDRIPTNEARDCISHPRPMGERAGVRGCVRGSSTNEARDCISHPSPHRGGEGTGVRGSSISSFCKCLLKLFDAELVRYVAEMYGIGCWAVDDTMFPIIDKDLNVHNIKIQHYDTNIFSETFFHKDKGAAWWYAKKYIETHRDIPGTRNDVNCYFGEHLISRFPSATIVLVESPKNAVLGSCVWPQYVWVAAGNKGMLNRDRLECMRGRKVLVMPDADAAEEWRTTLSKMQDIATFVISEMVDEFRKIGPKADVGDWIIKERFTHIIQQIVRAKMGQGV